MSLTPSTSRWCLSEIRDGERPGAGRQPPYRAFREKDDLVFCPPQVTALPCQRHARVAFDAQGAELLAKTYYLRGRRLHRRKRQGVGTARESRSRPIPPCCRSPFRTGAELLELTRKHRCSIAEIMRRNERHWRPDAQIDAGLMHIWQVMQDCVARGCRTRHPARRLQGQAPRASCTVT